MISPQNPLNHDILLDALKVDKSKTYFGHMYKCGIAPNVFIDMSRGYIGKIGKVVLLKGGMSIEYLVIDRTGDMYDVYYTTMEKGKDGSYIKSYATFEKKVSLRAMMDSVIYNICEEGEMPERIFEDEEDDDVDVPLTPEEEAKLIEEKYEDIFVKRA